MSQVKGTIYIKGEKNVEVTKPQVTVGDVVQLESSNPSILPGIKVQKVMKFTENPKEKKTKKSRAVISVLKIISCIHELYPEVDIQNMGETDFIVTYEDQHTPGKFMHGLKVCAVVLITFIGAGFSVMAFNNDVDTPKLFRQIYEQLTGNTYDGFTILKFTYCVGLVIGILVFFNHFGKKRFSVDPTPMEVEMRMYETEIETTVVETYSRKGKETDVDTAGGSGSGGS